MIIKIERTKSAFPAMWEKGGGHRNTGEALIICGKEYEKLKPIYIRRGGHLANGQHALFVVGIDYKIIRVERRRNEYDVYVYNIDYIYQDDHAVLTLRYEYSMGQWDRYPPEHVLQVVDVAVQKAFCYHCREMHYGVHQ